MVLQSINEHNEYSRAFEENSTCLQGGQFDNTFKQEEMLSKFELGHQSQECKLYTISANNSKHFWYLFLL